MSETASPSQLFSRRGAWSCNRWILQLAPFRLGRYQTGFLLSNPFQRHENQNKDNGESQCRQHQVGLHQQPASSGGGRQYTEENVAELDEEKRGRVNDTVDDGVARSDVAGKENETGKCRNNNCPHQGSCCPHKSEAIVPASVHGPAAAVLTQIPQITRPSTCEKLTFISTPRRVYFI
jgi:hypothetical protein